MIINDTKIYKKENYSKKNKEGIFEEIELDFEKFERGTYSAHFQKYDPLPNQQYPKHWPSASNRLQSLPFKEIGEIQKEGGLFLILKIKKDDFLVVLPVTSKRVACWLTPKNNKIFLTIGNLGTDDIENENFTYLITARTNNVYDGCHQVFKMLTENSEMNDSLQLLKNK